MAVLDIMTLLGIIITEMYKTFKILLSTSSKIDLIQTIFPKLLTREFALYRIATCTEY